MTFVSDAPRPSIPIAHNDHRPAPEGATFGNAILDSLGLVERHVLAPSLERVPLRVGECLEPPGQPIGYVYFPVEGLISMFAGATPGTRIEIATVGNNGMTGPGVLLGDMTAGEALVQAAGSAWRIAAGPLQRLPSSILLFIALCWPMSAWPFARSWTPSATAAARRSSSGWRTGCCRRQSAWTRAGS